MVARVGKYSRIVWLEIRGIPFEMCSLENFSSIAKTWGETVYIDKDSIDSIQSDSLFCLTEVLDVKRIDSYGYAYISDDHSIPIRVTEVDDNVVFKRGNNRLHLKNLLSELRQGQCHEEQGGPRIIQDWNLKCNVLDGKGKNRFLNATSQARDISGDPSNDCRSDKVLLALGINSQSPVNPQVFERMKEASSLNNKVCNNGTSKKVDNITSNVFPLEGATATHGVNDGSVHFLPSDLAIPSVAPSDSDLISQPISHIPLSPKLLVDENSLLTEQSRQGDVDCNSTLSRVNEDQCQR